MCFIQSDSNEDETSPSKRIFKGTSISSPLTAKEQATDPKEKPKKVQSTIPLWLDGMRRPKIVDEDSDLPKIQKLPKRTPKPTTPKRPRSEAKPNDLNTSIRKVIDEPSTSTNDDNIILITSTTPPLRNTNINDSSEQTDTTV